MISINKNISDIQVSSISFEAGMFNSVILFNTTLSYLDV